MRDFFRFCWLKSLEILDSMGQNFLNKKHILISICFLKVASIYKDGKNSVTVWSSREAKSIIIIHLYCNHNDQNTPNSLSGRRGGPNGMDNLWENDWKKISRFIPRDWHVFQNDNFFTSVTTNRVLADGQSWLGRLAPCLLRTQISAEPSCSLLYVFS